MARLRRVATALVFLSLLIPGLSSGIIVKPHEEGTRTARPRERVPDQGEPRTAQPRQRAPDQEPRTAEPRQRAPEQDGRKAQPREPARRERPRPTVVVRGRVFIGGYFYDPVFGPYLRPGSSLKLHDRLERLPPGVRSEPPMVAPPLPPPPHGTYQPPRTAPPVTAPAPGPVRPAAGFGTLEVRVQPVDAVVTIDGERWLSSDDGRYVLQVSPGGHRVEVARQGHQSFSMEVEVREGAATPLNVSLAPTGK